MGKMKNKREKKQKLEIVFDPKSRIEFLTGFRKRKNERKKRAKEDLERLLKEERIRIRQEVKDEVKHFKKSYEPIPDFEELLKEDLEDEKVSVKIVQLSSSEIAAKQNWLGENYQKCNENEDKVDSSEASEDEEQIPGMSVVAKKKSPEPKVSLEPTKKEAVASKKDLDRIKQKKTLKSLQKSKLFKIKQQFDKLANKKKARKERGKQIRELKKKGRKVRSTKARKMKREKSSM